jgi:hypothetical protein
MRPEIGKFYKDGLGDKVGPILKNSSARYPFRCVKMKRTYAADGRYNATVPSQADLVSEWIEPAQADSDAAQVKTLGESLDVGSHTRTPLPETKWKAPDALAALAHGIEQEEAKQDAAQAFYGDLSTVCLMGVDLATGPDYTAFCVDGRKLTFADLAAPGYQDLAGVLESAHDQAARGKGAARHANDRPFDEQPIMVIPSMLGSIEGQVYQIIKKAQEANSMAKRGEDDAAMRELLGIINYAAAAVLVVRD